MVLVDASVWIAWLRGSETTGTSRLSALLEEGEVALAPVILQELLQGAESAAALRTLRRRFMALPMVEPSPLATTYPDAGALYARCRWAGITPRSPHDCLIAVLAVENDLPLLHDDRDFELIAQVEPRLSAWRG